MTIIHHICMKLLHFLIIILLSALSLSAATYGVRDVPNVHVADSSAFVADPDGLLTPGAKARINQQLRKIRRTTSAEPMAVIVGDIDSGDIDGFATDLFEHWGLGKSDKDNGLLILVAVDARRAAIRTGYGLEGALPDITCGRILRELMYPSFRKGDYGTGMALASATIADILTDPDVAAEFRSDEADRDMTGGPGSRQDDGADVFSFYLILASIAAGVMLVVFLGRLYSVRNRNRHDRYAALESLRSPFLIFTFLGIGIPIVASLPLMLCMRRLRNAPRKCGRCGHTMTKLDEAHDNDYLSSNQDYEERLGSVDYDVWLCSECGERDIERYVNRHSGYRECPVCYTRAEKLYRQRVLRQPTVLNEGEGVNEYRCSRCGNVSNETFKIPVLPPPVRRHSGFGGGGFGGGGSFGGGFGGGHTGGGGASGGW